MTRRKKAWGPSNALWRWQHRKARRSGGRSKTRRSVSYMGRRRYGRRRSGGGGFGMGRLLSIKNIAFTLGGAMFGGQIGAAAGGYLGSGISGAIAGYLIGVPAASAVSGVIGGSTSGATAWVGGR